MSNNSLPLGFEKLKTEKPYVKPAKLPDGDHKFRIVGRPIAGWIDWDGKRPHRFKPENKPASSFDPTKKVKAFWALHVWDYAQEGLYVMEVTQVGIIKSLEDYALNEDWGDLTTFDIKIKKEGTGIDTSYTVTPVPHKSMSEDIKTALKSTIMRLEALYEGKDPWTDLKASNAVSDPTLDLTESQMETLQNLMFQIDDESLDKLYKHLGINYIFDLMPKDYDRTVRSMEKKIREIKGEANDSAA